MKSVPWAASSSICGERIFFSVTAEFGSEVIDGEEEGVGLSSASMVAQSERKNGEQGFHKDRDLDPSHGEGGLAMALSICCLIFRRSVFPSFLE